MLSVFISVIVDPPSTEGLSPPGQLLPSGPTKSWSLKGHKHGLYEHFMNSLCNFYFSACAMVLGHTPLMLASKCEYTRPTTNISYLRYGDIKLYLMANILITLRRIIYWTVVNDAFTVWPLRQPITCGLNLRAGRNRWRTRLTKGSERNECFQCLVMP